MIQQSAFMVKHPGGEFIGIVAYNGAKQSGIVAAQKAWGNWSTFRELTAEELVKESRKGEWSVFTASVD